MEPVLRAESPAVHKRRIALWDNAKFVMMALVVIDHALATVRTQSHLAFSVYTVPFFVHMPVMLFIAGYFARPTVSRKSVRAVLQLLAAWVIWECIWALIRGFVAGSAPKSTFLVAPAWTLWFLLTLATLRILLPYVLRMRYPIVFATVVALIAGCSTAIGTELSISRTLCFLPIYVAGWIVRDRKWLRTDWFVRPSVALRTAAWSAIGLAVIAVALVSGLIGWRLDLWIRWDAGYQTLFETAPVGDFAPQSFWGMALAGIGLRALLLAVSAVLSFAVLLVLPRSKMRITTWGTRTLYVYLLHAPIIWLLRQWGFMDAMESLGDFAVLIIVVFGVALSIALSARWVKRLTRPIIEPRLSWLMRPRAVVRS